MKVAARTVVLACVVLGAGHCNARAPKTRVYRNDRWKFCVAIPADWKGPSEGANHTGAGFAAPDNGAAITLGALSNQPRSIILERQDAGSQMASLDDYRGATLNEWKKDASLTELKQTVEEPATLQQIPALHTVLTYKRDGVSRRHEALLALWNQTQYVVEYDATSDSAKRYEKRFQDVARSFQFQCGTNLQK